MERDSNPTLMGKDFPATVGVPPSIVGDSNPFGKPIREDDKLTPRVLFRQIVARAAWIAAGKRNLADPSHLLAEFLLRNDANERVFWSLWGKVSPQELHLSGEALTIVVRQEGGERRGSIVEGRFIADPDAPLDATAIAHRVEAIQPKPGESRDEDFDAEKRATRDDVALFAT